MTESKELRTGVKKGTYLQIIDWEKIDTRINALSIWSSVDMLVDKKPSNVAHHEIVLKNPENKNHKKYLEAVYMRIEEHEAFKEELKKALVEVSKEVDILKLQPIIKLLEGK